MGATSKKYVCKAVVGKGWRIWNRKTNRWWGNYYSDYPTALLDELNSDKRPDKIAALSKGSKP